MDKNVSWIYAIALALLVPALLINLGLLTFIDDEAIRALVALEMMLSGNYITPTLHGEYYYNKPPLYNWILVCFFQVFGRIDEFVARLPTVFATIGYGLTIFLFVRKHLSNQGAFLAAFIFITCGRMLFYDTLLGLIDITFSWCMFTLFMLVYYYFERREWLSLFLITYILTAIGFLFKGLPAIVFQGITLLTYFSYRREFWKLFSWQHIMGGLVFITILGTYYLTYHQFNDLGVVATTLLTESSKRTAVNHGIVKTVIHIFTFPFEMVYHFLPWSLLVIYGFRTNIRKLISQNRFIHFCLLIFFANIIIYWTSVEVYPRYLLMLLPLLFIVLAYLHQIHQKENTRQYRFLQSLFLVTISIIAVASFLPLFLAQTQNTPQLWMKTLSISIPMLVVAGLYYRHVKIRMPLLVVFLVLFRIGFDWFVLPDRNANDYGDLCRESSRNVGEKYKEQTLLVKDASLMQPTNSFYLTNERGAIIPEYKDTLIYDQQAIFIILPEDSLNYSKIDEIKVRHGQLTFDVVKMD